MNKFEKLKEIQQKLKAPKSQYNSFGKYNYRNCEDILESLKPLLSEQNCTVYITDGIILIGERYYLKATVHFVDNESADEITTTAYAREENEKRGMDLAQLTGSTSSYARKYALDGMFAIDDTKDYDYLNDGKDTAAKKDPKKETEKPVDWRHEYMQICAEKGIDSVKYATEHKITKSTTQEEFKAICGVLKKITNINEVN